MALSILEKVGLQKQAAPLKAELKAGTLSILDKLKAQRELAAIMAKLKGDAVKPAPAEEDEEGTDEEAEKATAGSVIGFAIGGAKHPAWTQKFADNVAVNGGDVVVSNESLNMAIILHPGDRKRPANRTEFKVAWPAYVDGTSKADSYPTISGDYAWAGVKSPFPPKLRKKVRRMIEQGMKATDRAFSEEVNGFKIEPLNNNGLGIKISKDGITSTGQTIQSAYAMWRTDGMGIAGAIKLLGEGETLGARARIVEAVVGIEYRSETMDVEERAAAIVELRGLLAEPSLSAAGSYSPTYIKTVLDKLVVEQEKVAPEMVQEETLSVRYLRGDFNGEAPDVFRVRILDVAAEGMALGDVKTGVTNWIGENPELVAA
ncbi:hypothetical protein [Aeromonas salmonicida]|uniref:hypothetical protein n=1 Tax=Aeromonas salmonicida TaxID=645 RepID=UPI00232F34CC|nr:hypothetical protein [Aeromonas salmonicida]WCH25182.1 hypothetical protein ONZ54_22680 [Aeromonas salmonicida]